MRWWRRSLGLRVVAVTLLTSLAVVVLLGAVLLRAIGHGLVDRQRRDALSDLESAVASVQLGLSADSPTGTPQAGDVEREVYSVVTSLARTPGTTPVYGVAVIPTAGGSIYFTNHLDPDLAPVALRRQVAAGTEAYTYIRLPNGERALLAGEPLTSRFATLEVYFAFPLTSQAQTQALLRSRLVSGGAVLVVLLVAIAGLVTRQVVRPVRRAAQVADRIGRGLLDERMEVRGEDDLARLATAFNDMTGTLQQQIGDLENLSSAQRRFTADVSHELRTPLTTVRMAADVLHAARADFPASVSRSAELLQHELDRFETLLGDLLEISRHDAGVAHLEAEPVDLSALVRQEVEAVAQLALRRGVVFDLSGVPSGPVMVEADRRRVGRILRNLLTNAVDYGEGQPVHLRLTCDDAVATIGVRDHGPGLTRAQAERVFDRFWRADPSRTRTTGGTGLGLSIAAEDARLHGGSLAATGGVGQGSTFTLDLPRVRAAVPA